MLILIAILTVLSFLQTFSLSNTFAPLTEEIIFRGLIFGGLLKIMSLAWAIFLSSLIFGLWHLKNLYANHPGKVLRQVFYAGTIFGPLLALTYYFTGSLGWGIIVHYLNNLLAYKSWNRS